MFLREASPCVRVATFLPGVRFAIYSASFAPLTHFTVRGFQTSSGDALQDFSVEILPRCQRRDHVAADIGESCQVQPRNFCLILEYEDGLETEVVSVKCDSIIVVRRALSRFGTP